MAKRYSFEFELSPSSIDNLTKELKNYQEELKKAKKYILEALAKYAEERIKHYISETVGQGGYPITNTLLNSIKTSPIVDDMVSIYTDLAYAKYVEFGTGIVGSNNPHPATSEANWTYGEKGWVYHGSDGNYYYTEGQEAHQFIYRAGMDIKENYLQIARQVLKERGLI